MSLLYLFSRARGRVTEQKTKRRAQEGARLAALEEREAREDAAAVPSPLSY